MQAERKFAYSIPEFCRAVGLGRTFVYGAIRAGRIKTLKAGRRTLIEATELDSFMAQLRSAR